MRNVVLLENTTIFSDEYVPETLTLVSMCLDPAVVRNNAEMEGKWKAIGSYSKVELPFYHSSFIKQATSSDWSSTKPSNPRSNTFDCIYCALLI